MPEQILMMLDEFTQYDDFEEKFKPKKTTDDCYTPPPVYEAIKSWAVNRYGLENRQIVRPFYPGGDYQRHEYPAGCVVLDNPPFSILSKICYFYLEHGIDFFLFSPGLSIFKDDSRISYVLTDTNIKYENGATVPTAFVTNMGDTWIETAPELTQTIKELQRNDKKNAVYEYPPDIITAAKIRWIDGKGIKFRLKKGTPRLFIRKIDANPKKGIYGSAFLLGKKAAAAAAAAAAEKQTFQLSNRELLEVQLLTKQEESHEADDQRPD